MRKVRGKRKRKRKTNLLVDHLIDTNFVFDCFCACGELQGRDGFIYPKEGRKDKWVLWCKQKKRREEKRSEPACLSATVTVEIMAVLLLPPRAG